MGSNSNDGACRGHRYARILSGYTRISTPPSRDEIGYCTLIQFTSADGEQRLGAHHREWTMVEVDEVAMFFESTAIEANDVYHRQLVIVRP